MTPKEFTKRSIELLREKQAICEQIKPFLDRITSIDSELGDIGSDPGLLRDVTPLRVGHVINYGVGPSVVVNIINVHIDNPVDAEPLAKLDCVVADQIDSECNYITLHAAPDMDWHYIEVKESK